MIRSFWILGSILISCSSLPVQPTGKVGLIDDLSKNQDHYASYEHHKTRHGDLTPKEVSRIRATVKDWVAPLKRVQVTSRFGKRGRSFHEGVDLKAKTGTPVYAVSDGKVVYAGNKIGGYGKMIVLEHSDNLYSVYAHNSSLKVKSGASVKKGETVALSGRSGKVTGPHLHFELRKGTVPVDPALFLTVVTPGLASR